MKTLVLMLLFLAVIGCEKEECHSAYFHNSRSDTIMVDVPYVGTAVLLLPDSEAMINNCLDKEAIVYHVCKSCKHINRYCGKTTRLYAFKIGLHNCIDHETGGIP